MNTWLEVNPESDFSIHNIPFGIFSLDGSSPRIGSAIGDQVIDLRAMAGLGLFDKLEINKKIWDADFLNPFIALGKSKTQKVRETIQQELTDNNSVLKTNEQVFIPRSEVKMHLPVQIGDYTDFYSSIHHATNVGKLFRDPENALLPNWRHLPVGYHGRASSIIVSGEPLHRPMGQQKPADGDPVYGASKLVDFELEMGFIIGRESKLGHRISTKEADEYIFGKVLFNDWSARDIQKWEYVPLGPFLGKSFGSSMSPWVITTEALAPFQVPGLKQEPKVLPYLEYAGNKNIDIKLEVAIQPENKEETIISKSNFKYMYWTMQQQLAHHTVNGCNVKVGDLMASGTISGEDQESLGSLLEITKAGRQSLTLTDGTERKFVQDGDTIILRGHCEKDGKRVGFGEVRTQILPAL